MKPPFRALAPLVCICLLSGCDTIPVVFPASSRACGADAGCAVPLVCDTNSECVECFLDSHCSAASPACDPATHRCVPCRGAIGCSSPSVCSPSASVCVLPCVDGSNCPGFIDSCRSNVCAACSDADDCAQGKFCDVPLGRCVACLRDEHCGGRTPKCHQAVGLCEACIRNVDCPAGGACFRGECR